MVDLLDYDIRYTDLNDLPYLKKWLEDPEMLFWFPMSNTKEIDEAASCWMSFSKLSCSLTAISEGVPCAIGTLFLMPYRKVSHHCMFKVIVDKEKQKKGVGTSLIRNLKHLAKNYFRLELIHTEVFEGNPLISILKKEGFKEFARQEGYVKDAGSYRARVLLQADLKESL